jgi:amino acid transporter
MGRTGEALKRLLIGRPMASGELEDTLLPKVLALPVFSSDPLSSNAYATQEILLVLGLVGASALGLVLPIAIAVGCLLAIVVTSYRQTVRAYPTGGGAYRVSRENLGIYAGLTAASALLADYVLTVSVSVTAGVDAIVSAATSLKPLRIELAIVFIFLVALANLRGVKESGTLFAIPTYGFVASIYLLLLVGFVKCLGGCPQASSANIPLEHEAVLSFFLVLKAFAAGTTALTGVEAISDGVQAFRYPQSKNAATTLTVMGCLAVSMFLGISWLADATGVRATEASVLSRSVVADIADTVFSGGPLFYVVQAMTAGILVLAANTAFQDFPRLSSILAQDRFMPRQFVNRGDRLVFSNGIIILGVLASLLVIIFEASLTRLIQLYLVGVFISFTLSQTGMVLRGRKLREPGWRRRAGISGFGAVVTGIVFFVILGTKFTGGAWIVISAIPIMIYAMVSVRRHYDDVARQLDQPERKPTERRPGNHHMIILVEGVNNATSRAVSYARSIPSSETSAVCFDRLPPAWEELAPEIPIEVLSKNGSKSSVLRRFLREKRSRLDTDDFLTVIVPEVLHSNRLSEVLWRPGIHRLKASLLSEVGVQVLDVPLFQAKPTAEIARAHLPARNYAVVLVAAVHNAARQAIEYAESLQPTDLRAVSFGLLPEETGTLMEKWIDAGIPHPLEIEESPFREIGTSLVQYVRRFHPDGVNRVVTVVIPEFVVPKRRHQILHGQTALVVKRHLLFEEGVVAVSVPYHLSG